MGRTTMNSTSLQQSKSFVKSVNFSYKTITTPYEAHDSKKIYIHLLYDYISGVNQLSKNDYNQISLNQLVKNPN